VKRIQLLTKRDLSVGDTQFFDHHDPLAGHTARHWDQPTLAKTVQVSQSRAQVTLSGRRQLLLGAQLLRGD
jgi:hypothetical protein